MKMVEDMVRELSIMLTVIHILDGGNMALNVGKEPTHMPKPECEY